jgi:hypothetical protein
MEDRDVMQLFVDALADLCADRRLPFNISLINDRMRRFNRDFVVRDCSYGNFSRLAREMERKVPIESTCRLVCLNCCAQGYLDLSFERDSVLVRDTYLYDRYHRSRSRSSGRDRKSARRSPSPAPSPSPARDGAAPKEGGADKVDAPKADGAAAEAAAARDA